MSPCSFQVEVKRAEKREPKNTMGGMPPMTAYGHPGAHAGYATGQYAQQGTTRWAFWTDWCIVYSKLSPRVLCMDS